MHRKLGCFFIFDERSGGLSLSLLLSRIWAKGTTVGIFALLTFFSSPSWSEGVLKVGNAHEHLSTLPSARQIALVDQEIFNQIGKMSIRQLYKTNWLWLKRHLIALGANPPFAGAWTVENMESVDFETLCRRVSRKGDAKDGLIRLLEFPKTWNPKSASALAAFNSFKSIEQLRKVILSEISISAFTQIFNSYLREETKTNRARIDVSVSSRFFKPDQVEKLLSLKTIASKFPNSQMRLYYSLQRNEINYAGLNEHGNIDELLSQNLVDGIDIVGSLGEKAKSKETPRTAEIKLKKFKRSFDWVFQFAIDHDLEVRVHMFEEHNAGPFYEAFKLAIHEFLMTNPTVPRGFGTRTLKLRIGHLSKLNQSWLEFFKNAQSNPEHLHIEFDANPYTEWFVRSHSYAEIERKILWLLRNGQTVGIGADGRGVYPQSSPSNFRSRIPVDFHETNELRLRGFLPPNLSSKSKSNRGRGPCHRLP